MMFQNYRAYREFSYRIRTSDRFALCPESQEFLEIFRQGINKRRMNLEKGNILYRALHDYTTETDWDSGDTRITGVNKDRILPNIKFAVEGRVNPSGTVVLYLASLKTTAISEVRPWIGEMLSIAHVSVIRDLKVADLTQMHDAWPTGCLTIAEIEDNRKIPKEKSNKCTWADIDGAFSRPTTRTDTGAEYAPTQILTEAIKSEGFDGVVYKSSFGGERGYNIALFNVEDVEIESCSVVSIDSIDIDFNPIGIGW